MIDSLLLFGATGDLAGRLLMPALASLHAANKLPSGFRLTATSRKEWGDDRFREHMTQRLERHASHIPLASREALVTATSHRPSDVGDPESLGDVIRMAAGAANGPIAAYLALPQGMFASVAAMLGEIGLPHGSRLVVEKPFGEDLDGAIELNRVLAQVAGDAGEEALYRVDHVLGMATVHNLLGLRFANTALAPVWNSDSIEQIDILWEETLALEGRATFYDRAGALKDVLQNHMIQVLCYAAMEPPAGLGARDIQDRKVELLNAVRPITQDELTTRTRRARYTAGPLAVNDETDGRPVPDYIDEEGVDPARETETFAEIVFAIDNARWRDTRFVLRTGKALAERRKEVVVHFRPAASQLFQGATPNMLRIGIDGPFETTLGLNATAGDSPEMMAPMTLASPPMTYDLPPYANVLFDVLSGGSAHSVRGDEAEASWRAVTPVLEGWAAGLVPMDDYPAGSDGPPRLDTRSLQSS